MKYIYKEKKENKESTAGFTINEIEVKPERWVWGVIYKNDTELHQFGDDGIFHRIGEIDQDQVKMFTMYRYDDMTKRIDMPWQEGMKLIHKYINFHSAEWEDLQQTKKIYVIGYKIGENHHYTMILPDDRIIISPEDNVDFGKFNI